MAYKKFIDKLVNLQSDWGEFKVDFLDRDGFREFANDLRGYIQGHEQVCITGYFSETIRKELERTKKSSPNTVIRLISPEFPLKSSRDRKNIQVLKRLSVSGIKVKMNNRLHTRLLIAFSPIHTKELKYAGLMILGSFDFNTECIGRERYDAGIITKHPDLLKAAIQLFEEIWSEQESKPIEDYGGV